MSRRKESSYAKEGNFSYFGEYEGGVVEGIGTGVDWNRLSRYISPMETAMAAGSSAYISDIFTSVEGIPIYANDGTVANAGYSWQNERTTVRYRIGLNNIGESIAGVLKYDWNATRLKLASSFSLDITDMTSGSVLYAGSGGRVSQNNASFFWDNANVRLTVGKARIYTPGTDNVIIGEGAGNLTLTGTANTVLGYFAFASVTDGTSCTAIGDGALTTNTTGDNNTAIGWGTVYFNVTGSNNTGVGYASLSANLASSNSALGARSMEATTSGAANVGIGFSALLSNTTGGGNVALGYQAGYSGSVSLQTNEECVFLGPNANTSANGRTNAIAIGSGAQALASNQAVLGHTSITSTLLRGAVEIGTSAVDGDLTIWNDSAAQVTLVYGSGVFSTLKCDSAGDLFFTCTGDEVQFRTSQSGGGFMEMVNTTASGSAHAWFYAETNGGSGGDPAIFFAVSGVKTWGFGIDNSDSDKFKVSENLGLGTNDRLNIEVGGTIVFNEGGADADFRAEGDNKTSCLLLDASDDEVAIDGRFSLIDSTPDQLTGDQNNYAGAEGTATSRSSVWRISSDASRNITGIAGGLQGRCLRLVNVGAQNIVIQNQNAGSSDANKIITGTGADITMAADDTMDLWYDSTTARWRVFA